MAHLPNRHRAVIEPAKLRDYLLSAVHPVGRFKVTFFTSLGYSSEDWVRLEQDIRAQHLARDVFFEEDTPHGRKYVVRGNLIGPNGRSADLISVWIVSEGDDVPRFITAYPARPR